MTSLDAGTVQRTKDGAWVVTGFTDARHVLSAPQVSKRPHPSRRNGSTSLPAETLRLLGKHMFNADPPEHTRLRRLVASGFTPHRLERLRPRVQEITDDLLDRMVRTDGTDLLAAFAFPLPLKVLCEFVGLPARDHELFLGWTEVLLTGTAPRSAVLDVTRAMHSYIQELVSSKRGNPRDDVLSDIVRARHNEDELTGPELVSTVFMLITAGFDTTANLIGNGTYLLLTHPDQHDLLRSRPELVPGAVEEFLRYLGPVEKARTRFTREPLAIGDTVIPAHEAVVVSLASANRDPATFPDPDRLDVSRHHPGRHLTFGHGTHFCMGASLARLQGTIAFTSLLGRFPTLRLAVRPDELRWRSSELVRGFADLPVTW